MITIGKKNNKIPNINQQSKQHFNTQKIKTSQQSVMSFGMTFDEKNIV